MLSLSNMFVSTRFVTLIIALSVVLAAPNATAVEVAEFDSQTDSGFSIAYATDRAGSNSESVSNSKAKIFTESMIADIDPAGALRLGPESEYTIRIRNIKNGGSFIVSPSVFG